MSGARWADQETAAAFVRAWQSSESTAEVAQRLGIASYSAIAIMAARLRKRGVPLKYMRGSARLLDIDALKAIAEELSGTGK